MSEPADLVAPLADWARDPGPDRLYLNANAVVFERHGVLILGRPGTGKSTLSLELMSLGAQSLSDDGLWVEPGQPAMLKRPDTAPALIEARGIGLLHAGPTPSQAPLSLAIDLDRAETNRLPPRRMVSIGPFACPLLLCQGRPALAATLIHMLRFGRDQTSLDP